MTGSPKCWRRWGRLPFKVSSKIDEFSQTQELRKKIETKDDRNLDMVHES